MRLGILPILGLIFITLKLAGPIAHWSWWLVLSPFFLAVIVIIGVLLGAIYGADNRCR